MKATIAFLFLTLHLTSSHSFAHSLENFSSKPVLATLEDLQQIQAPIWAADEVTGIGFSYLTPELQYRLQTQSHLKGKCGGFEVLDSAEAASLKSVHAELKQLRTLHNQNQSLRLGPVRAAAIEQRSEIESALALVEGKNLRDSVVWLSAFPSRNEKSAQKNAHVMELKTKAEALLRPMQGPWTVELVQHSTTQQNSLKVTIQGSLRPQEIVVLGGHHDSTTGWFGTGTAPGADDNASGSANLLEILRILALQPQPERTIEIMWYAAEESGLVGSAEIAKNYKAQKKDVVAVLQLDMTAYPGSGQMTISSISDFTSPWLSDVLKQLNQIYVGLNIVDDKCGYACSDHASWYRQGYSTVVPFEATTKTMNPKIHTVQDIVSPKLNFDHSAAIAKLSLAFAMEMANSDLRAP